MTYRIYQLHKSIESRTEPDGYNIKKINIFSLEELDKYTSFKTVDKAEEVLSEKIENDEVHGQFVILPVYESYYDIANRKNKMG